MSKGKYKRKKQHRQQHTEEHPTDPSHFNERGNPEPETDHGTEREKTGESEGYQRMTFKERIKASSVTDWLLTFFTFVLAVFAIYQFVVIGGQLDVMRKDQRAWITVKIDFSKMLDAVPNANVTITNTGKTPGLHVTGIFWIEVIPNGGEPNFAGNRNDLGHTLFTVGALLPNDPNKIEVKRQRPKEGDIHNAEDFPFSDTEKKSLKDGTAWVALHGAVGYTDVFGIAHWTKCCTWVNYLNPTEFGVFSARSCAEYNSVDQK